MSIDSMRAGAVKYTAYNQVLDGSNTSAAIIIPFEGFHSLSILETWLSTLVASLTLELSNNYDPRRPTEARWTAVTDPAITTYLTTNPAAAPPGGKPDGVAGSSSLQIDPLRCAAVRFTATRTASSGLYTVDIEAA